MGHALEKLADLVTARQHQRILRLSFPNDDGPPCEFVVDRLDAWEGMARDFTYTVAILSDKPNIALKDSHGKLMNIELVRTDGTLRHFTAIASAAAEIEKTFENWEKLMKKNKSKNSINPKAEIAAS